MAAMSRLVYTLAAAPQHQFPNHPECPQRVTAIEEALHRLDVFQGCADCQVRMGRLPGGCPPPTRRRPPHPPHFPTLPARRAQPCQPLWMPSGRACRL